MDAYCKYSIPAGRKEGSCLPQTLIMHGVGVLTLKLATHTYSNAKQGWPSVLDLHPCAVPLASRSRCDEEARGRARGGTLEWMDE